MVVARPDVLLICVPAGLAIGGSGLDAVGDWTAAAFFVAIAASTVAVPVIAYLLASSRMAAPLDGLRTWLVHNNATVMSILLLVIGFVVIGKGLGDF